MKVGIYSPYLDSLGGGERYILTIAEFFLKKGDTVDIFWNKSGDLIDMGKRFGLDLRGGKFVSNPFSKNLLEKIKITQSYDLVVALSDGSIPLSFGKKNWLHLQVPFQKSNRPKTIDKLKFKFYEHIICNSNFTKKVIDKTYGINSTVVYPPVDVEVFKKGKKENLIISVGRFAASKKQQDLIKAFKKLNTWKLIFLGSHTPDVSLDMDKLRSNAKGFKIEFKLNVSYDVLKESFEQASIYWHGAGFGEDLNAHPENAEHFGITTVEAMSAGCVPVVFGGGGQLEIIEEGKTGFFWQTQDELIEKTSKLITDPKLREKVAGEAVLASKKFSKQNFYNALEKLLI